MGYGDDFTTETIKMEAEKDICEALKNLVESECSNFVNSEFKIENGCFYGRIEDIEWDLEPLFIGFTREHKNILIERKIRNWEVQFDFPVSVQFYKNGMSKSFEPEWPEFNEAKELPDIL